MYDLLFNAKQFSSITHMGYLITKYLVFSKNLSSIAFKDDPFGSLTGILKLGKFAEF